MSLVKASPSLSLCYLCGPFTSFISVLKGTHWWFSSLSICLPSLLLSFPFSLPFFLLLCYYYGWITILWSIINLYTTQEKVWATPAPIAAASGPVSGPDLLCGLVVLGVPVPGCIFNYWVMSFTFKLVHHSARELTNSFVSMSFQCTLVLSPAQFHKHYIPGAGWWRILGICPHVEVQMWNIHFQYHR